MNKIPPPQPTNPFKRIRFSCPPDYLTSLRGNIQTIHGRSSDRTVSDEGSFTFVGGNTELVGPNDDAIVSFGRAGKVVEVNAAGVETFDLTGLDGVYIFRASRIPSLYASERTGG